jgi:hypothetical protein
MSSKDIIVKPISAKDGNRIVRSIHYSGKVDTRSQLHFGIFMDGRCGGAMQFGPSVNKHASRNLFQDAKWNEWIELHRMAFADWLPRNSESRAIAVAMRMIKKNYPHISWVVSYSDAAQCGDGAIYRASGFVLTDIKKNTSMWKMPDGEVVCSIVFNPGFQGNAGKKSIKARYGKTGSGAASGFLKEIGAVQLPGFQLRYIYFLNPEARKRLTCPVIPFSEIERRGAGMYLGKPKRASSETNDTLGFHPGKGGATPTDALHSKGGEA